MKKECLVMLNIDYVWVNDVCYTLQDFVNSNYYERIIIFDMWLDYEEKRNIAITSNYSLDI